MAETTGVYLPWVSSVAAIWWKGHQVLIPGLWMERCSLDLRRKEKEGLRQRKSSKEILNFIFNWSMIYTLILFFLLLHQLPLLTCTTDGFYVVGLQGFMEDHDATQLALQGGRASPLTVLGPCRDELSHRLRLAPQQPPPGLRRQDASERRASGGCGGRGEGRVWDLGGRGSGGPVACWADATGGEWLWVENRIRVNKNR